MIPRVLDIFPEPSLSCLQRGSSPLDLAKHMKYDEVVEALQSKAVLESGLPK